METLQGYSKEFHSFVGSEEQLKFPWFPEQSPLYSNFIHFLELNWIFCILFLQSMGGLNYLIAKSGELHCSMQPHAVNLLCA